MNVESSISTLALLCMIMTAVVSFSDKNQINCIFWLFASVAALANFDLSALLKIKNVSYT